MSEGVCFRASGLTGFTLSAPIGIKWACGGSLRVGSRIYGFGSGEEA